jgi:hypothetical protein
MLMSPKYSYLTQHNYEFKDTKYNKIEDTSIKIEDYKN